jgi:hypothetical protein
VKYPDLPDYTPSPDSTSPSRYGAARATASAGTRDKKRRRVTALRAARVTLVWVWSFLEKL